MIPMRFVRALLALPPKAMLLLAVGCVNLPPMPVDPVSMAPPSEYVIGPADTLSVKLFYTPELNEDVVVRPDGRISLQLVGDVAVAGRTPEQVSTELNERYARFLTQPDVAVIMKAFGSQRAFVGGEVKIPSMIGVDGRMDLAGAVFQAGGALETAALGSVVLLRMGPNGREAWKVDLSDGLMGKTPLPVIRPYDVVFVPKSPIAEVNQFVELYINRMLPRNGSFFATYQIDQAGIDDFNTPPTQQ